jgi:hypothetical protein
MTPRPANGTGRGPAAALPAASRGAYGVASTPGTPRAPGPGGPGLTGQPAARVLLVRGPVHEPLDRHANNLIASGLIGATVAAGAVLIVTLVIPGPPLAWLFWAVAVGCLTIAACSIVVGVAVRIGLRCARAARRRQPPQATPDGRRPDRRVVIDGVLADPDQSAPRRRPTAGR